jgi:hypothetical protein
MNGTLMGTWVQDDTGPVLTMQKRYEFNPDGSYELVWSSRNTGSMDQKIQAREQGTFTADASSLTISPAGSAPRSFPWRIETNPYVGNTQLVMVLANGALDVYYPA